MAKIHVHESSSVADAVSEAWSIVEELASEMREAYDNTPESLQQSGVGEARGEAADALENLSEPEVPDAVSELRATFFRPKLPKRASRAQRLADGLIAAETAVGVVEEWLSENEGHEDYDEVESFRDELQDFVDEANNVSFPGMYG